MTKLDRINLREGSICEIRSCGARFRWQSETEIIENIPNWPRHALTTIRIEKTHDDDVLHKT